MRWLCLFLPCRWRHHMNVLIDSYQHQPGLAAPLPQEWHEHTQAGLYQCARCKTISIGAPRSL